MPSQHIGKARMCLEAEAKGYACSIAGILNIATLKANSIIIHIGPCGVLLVPIVPQVCIPQVSGTALPTSCRNHDMPLFQEGNTDGAIALYCGVGGRFGLICGVDRPRSS